MYTNLKNIFIFGSSGFAKEVFWLIKEINLVNELYKFSGFVDITTKETVKIGLEVYPVYREDAFFMNKHKNECFAIGIGNPSIIEKIFSKYSNFDFPNIIHPNFQTDKQSLTIGLGNIITSGCTFTTDVKIGNFNIFNLHTTIGHDCIVGNCNIINPGTNISGGVKIGNNNLIGTNSTVLQNLIIENNSVLGAGSVLTKNLESKKISVGSPAKVIKENE